MNPNTATLSSKERVNRGQAREAQIAKALRDQCSLNIQHATGDEDKEQKVDRWLIDQTGCRHALQIKYRETGDDILFEVFDRFIGWDHEGNKPGRDVQGISTLYAVLRQDGRTINLVHCAAARAVIKFMVEAVQAHGWTVSNRISSTFRYNVHGFTLELKKQNDPRTGEPKMIAYIPAGYFEAEAQMRTFKVGLPKRWGTV